jgi:hypothetical protein
MSIRVFSASRAVPVASDQSPRSTPGDALPVDVRGLRSDLAALGKAGARASHERQQAWLSSLERRLGQASPAPAARQALLAEVAVLDFETRLARKRATPASASFVESDNRQLLTARRRFGEALIRQFDDGGDPVARLWAHVDGLDPDPPAQAAVLNALHAVHGSDDRSLRRIAAVVCRRVGERARRLQAIRGGASLASREAPRMPNDCLVHLSCVIDDALARHPRHPRDRALREVSVEVQDAFLRHKGPLNELALLVPRAAARLRELGEPDAAKRCLQLLRELPAADDAGNVRLNRQQLHDNPYGRAFDSLFAADLVKTPPPGMLSAVSALSQAFAGQLRDTKVTRRAAEDLRLAMRMDPRAWQPLVPGCQRFIEAPKGQALEALVGFLQAAPRNGPDAMAKMYLVTYLGEKQRSAARELHQPQEVPHYLQQSADAYDFIAEQRAREAPGDRVGTARTRGTGILLRHQPAATDEAGLLPSHRPSTLYRLGALSKDLGKQALGQPDFSPTVNRQLMRGLAFGSGVSGSTNMLLYLYAELRDKGLTRAPARDVLLACATLMNYDGGHSIHEALWTGNLLDKELGLGLGLSRGRARPENFVLDHKAFVDGFSRPARQALRRATDRAWSGTQDYLRKHSYFAGAD